MVPTRVKRKEASPYSPVGPREIVLEVSWQDSHWALSSSNH